MSKTLLIGSIVLLLICVILISIALYLTILGANDTYKTICYTGGIMSGLASLILYGFYSSEKNKFN